MLRSRGRCDDARRYVVGRWSGVGIGVRITAKICSARGGNIDSRPASFAVLTSAGPTAGAAGITGLRRDVMTDRHDAEDEDGVPDDFAYIHVVSPGRASSYAMNRMPKMLTRPARINDYLPTFSICPARRLRGESGEDGAELSNCAGGEWRRQSYPFNVQHLSRAGLEAREGEWRRQSLKEHG